jgi:hypothetical protein
MSMMPLDYPTGIAFDVLIPVTGVVLEPSSAPLSVNCLMPSSTSSEFAAV